MNYIIEENLLKAVISYLSERPIKEAGQIFTLLQQLKKEEVKKKKSCQK